MIIFTINLSIQIDIHIYILYCVNILETSSCFPNFIKELKYLLRKSVEKELDYTRYNIK